MLGKRARRTYNSHGVPVSERPANRAAGVSEIVCWSKELENLDADGRVKFVKT